MPAIITRLKSIRNEFVAAPKGQGFKAIGPALKAIFSPKKPNPSSVNREVTTQISDLGQKRARNSQFHAYEARYGDDRDKTIVRDEFEAMREILDLYQENSPHLYSKLFELENKFSGELRRELIEARESASQEKIQGFIENHLQSRMNIKENAQFASYKTLYGSARNEQEVFEEFLIIKEIIEFFQDDANMWTDYRLGNLLLKLPQKIQVAFRSHLRQVECEGGCNPKLNAEHVAFFTHLMQRRVETPVRFNMEQNEKTEILQEGNGNPVVQTSHTRQQLNHVNSFAATIPDDQQKHILATGRAFQVMQVWKCRRDAAKRFVFYRDAYSHERDIETIINEYFAVLEILDLAKKDDPALYEKLVQFKAYCPTALQAKLAEVLSYSSKEKIEKFIEELELREKYAKGFPTYKKCFCKGKSEVNALREYEKLVRTIENWKKLGDTEMVINSIEHPFMAALFLYSATDRTPEYPPDVDFVKHPELLLKPFTFTFADAVEFFEHPERWEHHI